MCICVFLGIVCVFVYFCLSFCVVNEYCKLRWIKIIIIIIILLLPHLDNVDNVVLLQMITLIMKWLNRPYAKC